MTTSRTVRRGPPTKEELEMRQRARVDRIRKASVFPWPRVVAAVILAAAAIVWSGGGIVSLLLALVVIIAVFRAGAGFTR